MNSRQIALCGVLVALAVTVMLLGGVIPIATFCAPMLAMVVLLPVLEECGSKLAGAAYGAVAILALLLVPDRELALVYVGFGWYPILRPVLTRIRFHPARLAVKLAVYSGVILLLYSLLLRLMGLTADLLDASRLANAALFLCGGFTFLMLDLMLERLTKLWHRKLQKRLMGRHG